MVRMYFLTLYFLLGTFLLSAQNQAPCSDFNDSSNPAGNWHTAPYPNGMVGVNFGSPNSLDGSQYLILNDLSGSSWYINDKDYMYLGERFQGQCLYFDFYLEKDGGYGAPIHPRITLSNATQSITFVANITVTPGSGWVRIKAPIAACTGSTLPSNSDGTWTMDPSMTCADFNAVMFGSTTLSLSPDYTSSPSEVVMYDNICVKPCEGCNECNSNFKIQMTTSTSGGYTVGQIFLESTNSPSLYKVNWGDGTVGDVMTSHTYLNAGSYKVCVTQYEGDKPKCTTCVEICIPKPFQAGKTVNSTDLTSPLKDIADVAKGEIGVSSEIKDYTLVPNPAKNYVDVQTNLTKRGNVAIKIMDASGKILINTSENVENGRQSIKINTEKLIQGTYIVEIKSENKTSSQKLLISK
ncbi:hypothetical protein GCM10023210_39730 [Chryseobacterium ginsengisoli]|uniref:PKD domain-containing protein n=2 Tax=Chryseobacterium ginsengisoli TaxID=363853 RepID=A0ABP9MS17_9FLAO